MAFQRPGVYVSEGAFTTTSSAGTNTVAAGFIAPALRGPTVATNINSWTAYKALFGDISDEYDLGYAVYQRAGMLPDVSPRHRVGKRGSIGGGVTAHLPVPPPVAPAAPHAV